jgi:bifunctional non-homologous end joining protein LigD
MLVHNSMPSVLRFIQRQLATSVDTPPRGSEWIHEVKYDGYRCQLLIEHGQVRVLTRNGHDWTDRYPSIVRAALKLRCNSAIIDGEAIVQERMAYPNVYDARRKSPGRSDRGSLRI